MEFAAIVQLLERYGMFFLFAVVFLEYLNLPGLPGAVVFLVAGVWLASSGQSFVLPWP